MRTRTRRPRTRDPVQLDGRLYRISAEAISPEPGYWLGRENGPVVCERLVPRSAWDLIWNTQRHRWEQDRRTADAA